MEKQTQECKCSCEQNKNLSIFDLFVIGGMVADEIMKEHSQAEKEVEEKDMPNASPLDLLSKKDYKRMNTYLKDKYGSLYDFIDENYIALLIALSEYEDVDFDVKIHEHIAANVGEKLDSAINQIKNNR